MSYTAVEGNRVPIRMWADPSSVEDQAMAQLRNVANLPWVHGIAVMPGVHYGKGATVGSVIAMREDAVPVGFHAHPRPVPVQRVPGVGGWDAFWAGFKGIATAADAGHRTAPDASLLSVLASTRSAATPT